MRSLKNATLPWLGAPAIEAHGDSGGFVSFYAEGNQASGVPKGLNFRIYDGNVTAITTAISIFDEHNHTAMSGLDHFDWSNLDVDDNETNDTFTVSWVCHHDSDATGVFTSGPIAGVSGSSSGTGRTGIGTGISLFDDDIITGVEGADLMFG